MFEQVLYSITVIYIALAFFLWFSLGLVDSVNFCDLNTFIYMATVSINPRLSNRLKKEISALHLDPPPGITCWPVEDNIQILHARMFFIGFDFIFFPSTIYMSNVFHCS